VSDERTLQGRESNPADAKFELTASAPAGRVSGHSQIARSLAGVFCGILSGLLITNSFAYGVSTIFGEDSAGAGWGLIQWGQHWAVRTVASLAATVIDPSGPLPSARIGVYL
jgi:hypothetical protein